MKFEYLMLKQLEEQLKEWKNVKKQPFPKKGWVNLIRSVLGLSSYHLAKRMRIRQARVIQIESAEQNGTVTLNTLRKAAEVMGCQLVYGFVPKTTLEDVLKKQAEKVARKRIERVSHSMSLEAQSVDFVKQKKQFDELVESLLRGSPKKIWSNE